MKVQHKESGFTLVEMIIYIGIFSIIFSMVLVLFGRVQISGNRAQIGGDIKENSAQIMEQIGRVIREADGIDTANSALNVNPGRLVLTGPEKVTIDTHVKGVSSGGQMLNIRKIKLSRGSQPAIDISSDHVDTQVFQLSNLAVSGQPASLQIQLDLSSLNVSGEVDYDDQLVTQSTFTIRKDNN